MLRRVCQRRLRSSRSFELWSLLVGSLGGMCVGAGLCLGLGTGLWFKHEFGLVVGERKVQTRCVSGVGKGLPKKDEVYQKPFGFG